MAVKSLWRELTDAGLEPKEAAFVLNVEHGIDPASQQLASETAGLGSQRIPHRHTARRLCDGQHSCYECVYECPALKQAALRNKRYDERNGGR